jgi:hypothetical protein
VPTTGEALDQLFGGLLSLDSSESSADLLGERDEDALRATDITEPIAVLVLHKLANQFGTVDAEPGNKERNSSLKVVDDDPHVVHPLNRRGGSPSSSSCLSWPLVYRGF